MHLQLLKACVKMFKKSNLAICRVGEGGAGYAD